ncbi:hypothetical protein C6P46_005802 [Rhodotorula mucilaginosa]|uniref:SET domain-containing protein n=1 Tax=Rhodotorula mucilaginosa TaxID=5537 RepID=A0A9P6VY52_RHOMI|nr:hypothetical protein C6P46_005802 [Rhodotorula mucilaginosa]
MVTAAQADTALGTFLSAAGGSFHPALVPKQDAYGTSIYTEHDLEIGTRVVCCPFSLAITPTQVRRALPLEFFPQPDDLSHDDDDDRRLMVLYLVLHLLPTILLDQISPELALTHAPYISALPSPSSIRTPLYFSPAERALLEGTNLDGATRDREQLWQNERAQVLARLRAAEEVKHAITWDRWLWACTMLSSRAFPSSLIDGDQPNSTPVLFPGIDLLNHRPTAKVTWSTDVHAVPVVGSVDQAATTTTSSTSLSDHDKGSLTIVLDEAVSAGKAVSFKGGAVRVLRNEQTTDTKTDSCARGGTKPLEIGTQVFNTYGAKSNEELLLGYGFVLPPPNPADILALKLSFPPPSSTSSSPVYARLHKVLAHLGMQEPRHTVPPSGEIPPALLAQMRLLVAAGRAAAAASTSTDSDEAEADKFTSLADEIFSLADEDARRQRVAFLGWENELDVLDALEGMLEAKAEALTAVDLDAAADPWLGEIRPEVREMIRTYRTGQIDIVKAALAHREKLFEATLARAQAEGIDLAFEGDEGDGDGAEYSEEE